MQDFLSPEVIQAHVAGFADVDVSEQHIEPVPGDEPLPPHIVSQHIDPASIDALTPAVQRQLACIVYAGINKVSVADALAVLARRNPRPTCAAGTLEDFNAGLARAREEMPDWFISPAELARRDAELAELEAARMADELALAETLPAEDDVPVLSVPDESSDVGELAETD